MELSSLYTKDQTIWTAIFKVHNGWQHVFIKATNEKMAMEEAMKVLDKYKVKVRGEI